MSKHNLVPTEEKLNAAPEQDTPPVITSDFSREFDNSDRLETNEYILAKFSFKNGLQIEFSYDELSGDYGLRQHGNIGESAPVVRDEFETLFDLYLSITPNNLPIPEELLDEGASGQNFKAKVKTRPISIKGVFADQLELPSTAMIMAINNQTTRSHQTCACTYYPWWHWHDPATPGLAPKCYYSSSFGGKMRYVDSFVCNCVPADWGSWLWARHRIYYKNAWGNYVKHYECKVAPGKWDAKTKGSIKRYRKVCYDDGWNSIPHLNLTYIREGRFRN